VREFLTALLINSLFRTQQCLIKYAIALFFLIHHYSEIFGVSCSVNFINAFFN